MPQRCALPSRPQRLPAQPAEPTVCTACSRNASKRQPRQPQKIFSRNLHGVLLAAISLRFVMAIPAVGAETPA